MSKNPRLDRTLTSSALLPPPPDADAEAALAAARCSALASSLILSWCLEMALNSATTPRVATRRWARSSSSSRAMALLATGAVAAASGPSSCGDAGGRGWLVAALSGTCIAVRLVPRRCRRFSRRAASTDFCFSCSFCSGVLVLDRMTDPVALAGGLPDGAFCDGGGAEPPSPTCRMRAMAPAIPALLLATAEREVSPPSNSSADSISSSWSAPNSSSP
mmetsp:Transcript_18248/g.52191  ORF Transcript_18248/g.52191 Transcript_18248/m.52191 type:complete len:219 (-) Transcript_18248:691-1347(-)